MIFIFMPTEERYALTVSSTVKMVEETFGYLECQTLVDKKKAVLGLEFSDSGRTRHAFKNIQDVVNIVSEDEWDCISAFIRRTLDSLMRFFRTISGQSTIRR